MLIRDADHTANKSDLLRSKLTYCIFISIIIFGNGCETGSKQAAAGQDAAVQDSMIENATTGKLKSIEDNYRRIGEIVKWDSVITRELNESVEGGNAEYYFLNGKFQKIVSQHFGETFHLLTEYYLLNGDLSYVYSKHQKYNRPFYYDSAAMKENGDTESFDPERSEISEERNFFTERKLLHQISNADSASTTSPGYLQSEQASIVEDFDRLVRLLTTG